VNPVVVVYTKTRYYRKTLPKMQKNIACWKPKAY